MYFFPDIFKLKMKASYGQVGKSKTKSLEFYVYLQFGIIVLKKAVKYLNPKPKTQQTCVYTFTVLNCLHKLLIIIPFKIFFFIMFLNYCSFRVEWWWSQFQKQNLVPHVLILWGVFLIVCNHSFNLWKNLLCVAFLCCLNIFIVDNREKTKQIKHKALMYTSTLQKYLLVFRIQQMYPNNFSSW